MNREFKGRMIPIACAAAFIALGMLPRARAQEAAPKERTVKVQGHGKVAAVPDQAELEFEVREEGDKLEEVSATAASKMKAVFQAVKSFGIPDKDFQTVGYNIQPKYKYDNGESQRVGFIVSNRVRVVLKKLDEAGKILEAVTQAGASGVQGPDFGFSDPTQLQIEALKAAMRDANAKAEALAQAAGAQLGKVFSITQTGSGTPPRPMMGRSMTLAMGAAAPVPVASGENDVTADVEVTYLLK